MKRREVRPERGKRGPVRIGLALTLLISSLFSLSHTIANAIARVAPEKAYAIAPYDGRIAATAAMHLFDAKPSAIKGEPATTLAKLSLRRDPTAVDALIVLALQAQLRGDTKRAREIFAYSLRLSRRELRPRLWAIEEAVGRGDIATALKNYDIALRTSQTAPQILFPTLSSAIAEEEIRSGVLQLLAKEPVWSEDFLRYAALFGSDPQATALLFTEGRYLDIPIKEDLLSTVVNRLAGEVSHERAWAFYTSFRKGVHRYESRDPSFNFSGEVRTFYDWNPIKFTTIHPSEKTGGGGVEFIVPPSTGGPLLQQHLLLPAGSYLLRGRVADIDQPESSRPHWSINCVDGAQVGSFRLPNSPKGATEFSWSVTVPPLCKVQTLTLVARQTGDIAGVTGRIEYVSVRPVRDSAN